MDEQVKAYIEYISNLNECIKPPMPNFDLAAYTENEYIKAVESIENDFAFTDAYDLTIDYLKGK